MGAARAMTGATFSCRCEHVFHVHGGGRHRIYFELTDAARSQPVMDRVCSSCGRRLPGMGRPSGAGAAHAGR